MKSLTDDQRRDLLIAWLEGKGVRVNHTRLGWQKVSCYGAGHFKGDRNPSASVNLRTGYYKCFGCDLQGDAVALLMQEEGLDFPTALATLGVDGTKPKEIETWI